MAALINAAAPFMVHGELKAFLLNARQIEDAKKAALDVETKALDLLLSELALNMRFLSTEDIDPWYQGDVVLVSNVQEIPFREKDMVVVEDKLTLYEDERLVRSSIVTVRCIGRHEVVLPDEKGITTSEAIQHFGFDAICEGVIWLIKNRLSTDPQMKEYQDRVKRANALHTAIEADIHAFGTLGGSQPCTP
jgi:hypothetical protein